MQHVIVGSLLVMIIVIAGWLICFFNKTANKKILVDDSGAHLNLQLRKRNDLLQEYMDLEAEAGFIPLEQQLKELEEKIEVCRYIYNDAVSTYNKFLSIFPNNVSARILGVKELPYFQEVGNKK